MRRLELPFRLHVEEDGVRVGGEGGHILPGMLCDEAAADVADDVARHVDGVFGGGEGRGVTQVERRQVFRRHAGADGGGEHVDALFHPFKPHRLRADDDAALLFVQHLQSHVARAGVIGGVVGRKQQGAAAGDARSGSRAFVQARGGGGHVEAFEHGRALRAAVDAADSADVVGGDAPLLVGGPSEGDARLFAGDGMEDLHRVAHGVDVGIGSAHMLVYDHRAARAQLQPRRLGEIGFGKDADGDQGAVCTEGFAGGVGDDAALLAAQRRHRVFEAQVDAVFAQAGVEDTGHVVIERRHHLFFHLQDGDAHAAADEVFRRLQADKAAADDQRALDGVLVQEIVDAEGVFDGAKGEDALVRLHKGRPHRLRARRIDQLIVTLEILLAARKVAHAHLFLLAQDLHRLAVHAHVHIEAAQKTFRRLQGQLFAVLDDAAYVVRKPAVGVRNVAAAFEHHDLRALV